MSPARSLPLAIRSLLPRICDANVYGVDARMCYLLPSMWARHSTAVKLDGQPQALTAEDIARVVAWTAGLDSRGYRIVFIDDIVQHLTLGVAK